MKTWRGLLALCLCGGALGCASAAKAENMVAEDLGLARTHEGTVHVRAQGGQGTNPLWMSEISDADFVEAVVLSIEGSGLFSSVVSLPDGADYRLEISILDVDQPAMGFDMTVTMTTRWTLTELPSGRVLLEEFLSTPHTAGVGDALAGVKRVRLANEGAARANIREGLLRLSELDLSGGIQP